MSLRFTPINTCVPFSYLDSMEQKIFKKFLRMDLDSLSQLILSGPSDEDRQALELPDDHFLTLARRARRHLTGAQVMEGILYPQSPNPMRDKLLQQMAVLDEYIGTIDSTLMELKSVAKSLDAKIREI